jgi:hypothetical protein
MSAATADPGLLQSCPITGHPIASIRLVPPSEHRHERLEAPQRLRFDAVAYARAVDLSANESRVLQHLEMLRDCRLRKVDKFDYFTTNTTTSTSQETKNLDTRLMAQGLHVRCELLLRRASLDRAKVKGIVIRANARLGSR